MNYIEFNTDKYQYQQSQHIFLFFSGTRYESYNPKKTNLNALHLWWCTASGTVGILGYHSTIYLCTHEPKIIFSSEVEDEK